MKTVEEHYRVISPGLTNYLVGNGLSYADACEVVQETFLRLWKMRETLRDDDSAVSGLVYTIARNIRNDRVRHARYEVFSADLGENEASALESSLTVSSPSILPSDARYLRARLMKALSELPDVLREAYTLFQVSEMSVREIAHQTDVSENLVKVRIHRAKLKLRESLADLKL